MTEETSTTPSTDEEPIDGALVDDKRIHKRLERSVSTRTFDPNWSFKKKQHDDGKHWQPPPGPYRRGED
jgi:hypothetical protein